MKSILKIPSKKQEKGIIPSKKQEIGIIQTSLNILILPGLGSLIGGKTKEGIWQLVLLIGGLFTGILFIIGIVSIIGLLIGVPILIFGPVSSWIWGIVTGVQLIKESEK
ncbi:MAG: hypothetical protein AABX88_01725 [Nanoarchaeota archaeon]